MHEIKKAMGEYELNYPTFPTKQILVKTATCMYAKDPSLRLLVRERELDLPVNTPGTNEGGVQRLNPVRRHDNLHKLKMTSF